MNNKHNAFENHYFQIYRDYLAGLLSGTEDEQRFAAERLTQVCYRDAKMVSTLRGVEQSAAASAEVRNFVGQALSLTNVSSTQNGATR